MRVRQGEEPSGSRAPSAGVGGPEGQQDRARMGGRYKAAKEELSIELLSLSTRTGQDPVLRGGREGVDNGSSRQ